MGNYEDFVTQDARLAIVRELAVQTDWRCNETILLTVLDNFGHKRSKDWLRTQLRALEELGAIKIHNIDKFMVAELTQAGLDHVERRAIIEGIKRPSPGV